MNMRILALSMMSFGSFIFAIGCGSDDGIVLGVGGSGSTSASSSSGNGSSGGESTSSSSSSTSSGAPIEKFSFFVTSLKALQDLSGSAEGFGGDLRYGETGPGSGLRGADKLCATIAERSMAGAGKKPWRAFLSAVADENGQQVNAKDRIGEGPWYDRLGRLLAANKTDLLTERPTGADSTIINDFPNEDGIPNHAPDPNQGQVDNHDMLTGTNAKGELFGATGTCNDWTSNLGDLASEGRPRVGHSWPRFGGPPPGGGMDGSMANWMSSLNESGCAPGVNLIEMGPPIPGEVTVGSGGGYGGFYCFSLVP
jgi:hypothetical protein